MAVAKYLYDYYELRLLLAKLIWRHSILATKLNFIIIDSGSGP